MLLCGLNTCYIEQTDTFVVCSLQAQAYIGHHVSHRDGIVSCFLCQPKSRISEINNNFTVS